MKCVQLVEDWLHRHLVGTPNSQYLLSLSSWTGRHNSLPMKFSILQSEGEMEAQVPGVDHGPFQSSSDLQWCGAPAMVPAHSPAWSHLKMELDLQAMMEEDAAPKCRKDLYLAFTHSAANEARDRSECRPDPLRVDVVPFDTDSLYDEASDVLAASAPKAEDKNLARLIAKFDSSIEALWNPDEATEIPEEFREEDNDDHLTLSPVPMDVHGSKQNLFIACGTNITSSIWSSRPSPEDPPREEWSLPPTVKWSEGDTGRCGDSLVVLNHNREDSSFTEVVPRRPHSHRDPPIPPPQPVAPVPSAEPAKEEEDLLTSARTHFTPIRQDPPTRSHHQSISYADGTTFSIPNSLERLAFTRSESGALYLAEDSGLDSPCKYMEYKDKDCYDKMLCTFDSDSEDVVDFVPKFRVSQNEKFCQTDQDDEVLEEDISKRQGTWNGLKSSCLAEEFYFPGDEQLSLEEEVRDVMESKRCGKCLGPTWKPGWPADWQEVQPSPQSWYQIWSEGNNTRSAVAGCWDCSQPNESHKSQLQRELSEDGEQLLSDLSSLLDQCGGVLSEIHGNKYDPTDKMAEYTINCKIMKAGPLGTRQDTDWVLSERPTNYRTAQKERKRRYSSSQRACSLFLEGSCRRPHCRFSHDMASIPCRFWADASCLKGGKCPFLHGGRPVTL